MSIAVNLEKLEPQPWMAYRNPKRRQFSGDCCPMLITGQEYNIESIEVKYGALYNWYAVTDARNICSAGFHVPTKTEFETLQTYLGSGIIFGGKLKETGLDYWYSPNAGATNEVGFNCRGAGLRLYNTGIYDYLKEYSLIWTSTSETPGTASAVQIAYSDSFVIYANSNKNNGQSVRPVKDSTTLSHGETGTYTDPSGYTYPTICIGTQEWVAHNIMTKHYRNGDDIPEVTNSAEWITPGANDWFLPSKDELNAMYTELHLYGVSDFLPDAYVSSSEHSGDPASYFWVQEFADGAQGGVLKLTQFNYPPTYGIKRACRAFISVTNYNLRDIGPAGGRIFWKSGNNYLEAAPSDILTQIPWSNIALIAGTDTIIGTGQTNTNAIITQAGHTNSAAKLCDDLVT